MDRTPDWSYETVLAAESASAAKTRDFVGQHLVTHDLLYLVEDIRLVASELGTNAMVHAGTPFVVTLSEIDGVVLLAIRDGSASVPVKSTPQVLGMGGRGLVLVELLSHEWGASADASGSKSVWASFTTRARPGLAPQLA